MRVYDVYDEKGNYIATFTTEGHALSYCHVLGLRRENVISIVIANKQNYKEIHNLNNG